MVAEDVIKKKAESSAAFLAGQALFREGKVQITKKESFWKGEQELEAKVMEGGSVYQAALFLKNGQIYEYRCSCGEYRGLCRHCVAAALETGKREKFETGKMLPSPALLDMIHQYERKRKASFIASFQEEPVSLLPLLSVGHEKIGVQFFVKGKRKYVIKDLKTFLSAMEEGALLSYGRYLEFYHTPEAFAKDSLPLLSFLLEELKGEKENFGAGPLRLLPLSRRNMDAFFALLSGKRVAVEDSMGAEKIFSVQEGAPPFRLLVEKDGRGGYLFELPETCVYFSGLNNLYLYCKEEIWICGPDFKRELSPFLEAAGKEGIFKKKGQLFVSGDHMPDFTRYVLPTLKKWAAFSGDKIEEDALALPLENQFYFDREDGKIFLQVKHGYGKERFSPLREEGPQYPYRDRAGEELVGRLVTRYFQYRLEAQDRFVLKEEEEKVFALLKEGLPLFQKVGKVYLSESFRQVKIRPVPKISAKVSAAEGWLTLSLDFGQLSEEEISRMLSAYRKKKKYFLFRDGSFGIIQEKQLGVLSDLKKDMGLSDKELAGEMVFGKSRGWYLNWLFSENREVPVYGLEKVKKMVEQFGRNLSPSVPEQFCGRLRDYQREGFSWLYTIGKYGFGGLLADEMGLGKTIQLIALLLKRKEEGEKNPFLIVCPASLVFNWEQELGRFAPGLKTVAVTGAYRERQPLLQNLSPYDVIVTSYELLKRDLDWYLPISFSIQVADEAQYIKNDSTQNARAVKKIHAGCRFALTGTPVENSLSELWSIFDYLMPGHLKNYSFFRERFEVPIVKEEDCSAAERLGKLTRPFLLRRLKRDVLSELPERLESVVYSGLSGEQKKLYLAEAAELKRRIEEGYSREKMEILAGLTRLRQICCDPGLLYENYKGDSAKFDTFMELLKRGLAGGHRILVFSQFAAMLERIEERLSREEIPSFLFTGKTPGAKRKELVEQFQKGEAPVFLISLKAGGTGLNLTAADMVIHYDPWWNVAAQNQATDRAHRIGQKKPVSVLKLIMRHTIEENILSMQQVKEKLAAQAVGKGGLSFRDLSKEQLLALLDWRE